MCVQHVLTLLALWLSFPQCVVGLGPTDVNYQQETFIYLSATIYSFKT